jgi:hypothetical protein
LVVAIMSVLPACAPISADRPDVAVASESRATGPGIPRTLRINRVTLELALRAVLPGTYFQIDQTDVYSHARELVNVHPICVPASPEEIEACRQECTDSEVMTIAMCLEGCSRLEDCVDGCGAHRSANVALWSSALKMESARGHRCDQPGDTCPPCTPGVDAPSLEDISFGLPNPIFTTSFWFVRIFCHVETLGIDINSANYDRVVHFDMGPTAAFLDLDGFASDPTLRCDGSPSDPTFEHPRLRLQLTPYVQDQHLRIGISGHFDTHVSYLFDWIYDLDDTVRRRVDGQIQRELDRNSDRLSNTFERWVSSLLSGGVDHFESVTLDSEGMSITYVPTCDAPVCSGRECGQDECGRFCGTCALGYACTSGHCQCVPSCGTRQCGDDGCGGSCGSCGSGETCIGGYCVYPCEPYCPPGHVCHLDGCGDVCGTCSATRICVLSVSGTAVCELRD